jgi:YHS domain-containing protein
MKKLLLSVLLAIGLLGNQSPLNAQVQNLKDGVAIQGYDPVAYFTQSKAIEGKKAISLRHHDAVYYFASEANKATFSKDPAKYEPVYGGYCAYAMAFGNKVKIDPETFKIKDGHLFLFYNFRFNNTLIDWNKEEAQLFGQAESEWKKINNKKQ